MMQSSHFHHLKVLHKIICCTAVLKPTIRFRHVGKKVFESFKTIRLLDFFEKQKKKFPRWHSSAQSLGGIIHYKHSSDFNRLKKNPV